MIELWCAERFVAKLEPKPEPKPDNGETTNLETILPPAACSSMCDKCEQLDKKIGHYQKLLLGIADQLTVDRIKSLIEDLQAQKALLHPEQNQ